nr:hypothetical protein [Methylorubrum thiocyanatum]
MLPPLPGLRTLRPARHLPDWTGAHAGRRAPLSPVEDPCRGEAKCDPLREMRAHRFHQIARKHVLHRTELGELAGPLGLAHRQVGTRIPALQNGLRARREAVGDELDRQVGPRHIGQRFGRVAQEGVVGVRPVLDRKDRRDGEPDWIAGPGDRAHGGEALSERGRSTLVTRCRGGVDREADARAPAMRQVEERTDCGELRGETQLHRRIPGAEMADHRRE